MTTVTITLRDGRTSDGTRVAVAAETIELDRLSPRARALALTVAASPGGQRSFVWLESDWVYGEAWEHLPEVQRAAHADPAHASQHALRQWDGWGRYHADDPCDPHTYLERQAALIPATWHIIGPAPHQRVADFPQPVEDWLAPQVAEHLGIKVTAVRPMMKRLGVVAYRHERGDDGVWRAVYSAAAVRAAHAARPGRGARTDLRRSNS